MLDGMKNKLLCAECLDYIKDQDVKDAFVYFLGLCACVSGLNCHIEQKGVIKDFQIFDDTGEQPHSFITNQKWLLFYFRPAAVRALLARRSEFESAFESFNENTAGEWTVKLRTIADVKRLAAHLAWSSR